MVIQLQKIEFHCFVEWFKAILLDVMGEDKFYFSLFSLYIYVMTLVL